MRIAAMAVVAGFMAIRAQAGDTYASALPGVTVCTEEAGDLRVASQSHANAARIFTAIGVRIIWHVGFRGCPAQGILITFMEHTPQGFHPGAMAYAMPSEGTHICLFYDRIAESGSKVLPVLLSHVLAHEIAHILQGSARHSDRGLMKSHWTGDDLNCMLKKPLDFTIEDIDLIHRGVEARASRLVSMYEPKIARQLLTPVTRERWRQL